MTHLLATIGAATLLLACLTGPAALAFVFVGSRRARDLPPLAAQTARRCPDCGLVMDEEEAVTHQCSETVSGDPGLELGLAKAIRHLGKLGINAVGFLDNPDGKPGIVVVPSGRVFTAEPDHLTDETLAIEWASVVASLARGIAA